MSGPLAAAASWRAQEGAVESGVPALVAGGGWWLAYRLITQPMAGRPLSELELLVIFGACAGLTGWAVGRQLFLLGYRRPRTLALWAPGVTLGIVLLLEQLATVGFQSTCVQDLSGELVSLVAFDGSRTSTACRIGGVAGNPYLPGTLVLPGWDGPLRLDLAAWMLLLSVLGAVGLREQRVRRTRLAARLTELLRLAPAAGSATSLDGIGPEGEVLACANPTLWGEPCGQLYPGPEPRPQGAWCVRCQQVFTPCSRELELDVVSLATDELDVLNGLERLDSLAWRWGEPPPPDGRISGRERWVRLGRVHLPDVLTVAQALALVSERLPAWKTESGDDARRAGELAQRRMSRVGAWLWFGRVRHRLTFARPTTRVRYGLGSQRLRDLVPESGEPLTLQLDIGLLPVEVRTATRRTFLEADSTPLLQNSKTDVWLPVGPPGEVAAEQGGRWVARIEGEALRSWLGTDRLQDPDVKGVSSPLPYRPHQPDTPVPTEAEPPRAGGLDLERRPLRSDGAEPLPQRTPGASIAEWDWLEWEQIELLRRECLVLVASGGRP